MKKQKNNIKNTPNTQVGLSSNDDKRMQSIDSIETYAYGMSKYLVSEKEEIKCNNIMKQCKTD